MLGGHIDASQFPHEPPEDNLSAKALGNLRGIDVTPPLVGKGTRANIEDYWLLGGQFTAELSDR